MSTLETGGSIKKRPGVGIAVIITHNLFPNCVLLGKRKGGMGSGLYQLPGGHLEFGESLEDCAYREVLEETGLTTQNIHYIHAVNTVNMENDYHYVTIFMKSEIYPVGLTEPKNLEPDKNEGWQWVNWNDLPSTDSMFWCLGDFVKTGINPFNC